MSRPNTPEEDAWINARRAAFQRATAQMPEILAELRAGGWLRPIGPRRWPDRQPRIDDPDYIDNGWTVETGQ